MNLVPDLTVLSRVRGGMSSGRFQDKRGLRSEFAAFYEAPTRGWSVNYASSSAIRRPLPRLHSEL
jgi:hypothetical protein